MILPNDDIDYVDDLTSSLIKSTTGKGASCVVWSRTVPSESITMSGLRKLIENDN